MEFTTTTFFKLGIFCFIVIALMSLIELYISFEYMTIYGIIRSLIYILFYSGLSYYFYFMLKQQQPQVSYGEASDDIDEIIKQVKEAKE